MVILGGMLQDQASVNIFLGLQQVLWSETFIGFKQCCQPGLGLRVVSGLGSLGLQGFRGWRGRV